MLLTNACQAGSDPEDFPMPKRNVLDAPAELARALPRVLAAWARESRGYQQMRQLYDAHISAASLRVEAVAFLRAHHAAHLRGGGRDHHVPYRQLYSAVYSRGGSE